MGPGRPIRHNSGCGSAETKLGTKTDRRRPLLTRRRCFILIGASCDKIIAARDIVMKLAAAQIIKSGSFERVATTGGGDGGNGRRASSIDYPRGGRALLGKNRPGLNAADAGPAGGRVDRVVRETRAGRHIWRTAASRAARTE